MTRVVSLANGAAKGKAAEGAVIASGESNGRPEGRIYKPKLVKRQMYGRGKLGPQQDRVIGFDGRRALDSMTPPRQARREAAAKRTRVFAPS